jgi:hypothetical protein
MGIGVEREAADQFVADGDDRSSRSHRR